MNSVVIVAAGSGKRMGLDVNKVFYNINDKPILYYTITAFEKNDLIDEIILVLKEEEIEYFNENFSKYNFKKVKNIAIGGLERKDSVYNGLKKVDYKCDIVLIHDGARPIVSKDIIESGIRFSKLYGAATPSVIPKDTIKIIDEKGFLKSNLVRNTLRQVQTPQCFNFKDLKLAYEKSLEENLNFTDDNEVYLYHKDKINEKSKVYLYEGDYTNIKVTTKEDLELANKYLNNI